jgi:histidine ammonia-lyase
MRMNDQSLMLDGRALAIDEVHEVACADRRVALEAGAAARVSQARAVIDQCAAAGEPLYGINTGFGSLSRRRIDAADIREVQRNLIRSHAAGVGKPLPVRVVRAMMLVLAASLARGRSGVRVIVIERLIEMLNRDITPIVPSRGSVGASGDLAPLAHIALSLIGEGKVRFRDSVMPTMMVFKQRGIEPITLEAKEGLALINGTHLMCASGALTLHEVAQLQQAAVCAAAMAVDGCRGTDRTLDPRTHAARNQPGQQHVAAMMRKLLEGSQIVTAHQVDDPRVQDPYCLRAAPQVLGAAFDAIACVRGAFECELGAVTDNPLVFDEQIHRGARGERGEEFGRSSSTPSSLPPSSSSVLSAGNSIVSGANFHGMPLAIPLDVLPIALCHMAGIAERRINWLLAASDSENPVNVYLSPQPGLHSGMMIAQYTAAACCNELQTLCTPASVANIPTSAGIEDYNSMGVTAAHQAAAAVKLARYVVAIELLVMAEAMEYQRPLRSGVGVERVYEIVRSVVPKLTADRPPSPDIERLAELIRHGAFDESEP